MSLNKGLNALRDNLKLSENMPVVFIGHGSPTNAIEDNQYTQSWSALSDRLPKPQAILVISAHWMTHKTTLVDVSAAPRTIHDFYGFPRELHQFQYPAKGYPKLAEEVANILAKHHVEPDHKWGLDHGAWSVLHSLFPAADVLVFQLSIDMTKDLNWHLNLGRELAVLRDRGVLILGSGNIVHNLSAVNFSARGVNEKAHDWALEFDSLFAQRLKDSDFTSLTNVSAWGSLMKMANPTLEHYIPAIAVAGASQSGASKQGADKLFFTTEGIDMASLSMRSFVFHGA